MADFRWISERDSQPSLSWVKSSSVAFQLPSSQRR